MSLQRSAREERSDVVKWATVRFASWSAVVLVVLVLGIVYASRQVARDVAVAEARDRVELTASIVAKLVTPELRDGDPAARRAISSVLMPQLADGTPDHIRLWGEGGEVIWADDQEALEPRYDLPEDVRALFGTEDTLVQMSPVDQSAVPAERRLEMLEVYAGGMDADGGHVVYEAYYQNHDFPRFELSVIRRVLPIAIGAVALLQLAVLPLALLLARRVQRSEAARGRLAEHALRASELERRRLAQELHDGVVQDLAGVGFVLPTLAAELPDTPSGRTARDVLTRIEAEVHEGIASLRTLMREVYPPDLARGGLEPAVRTLAARTGARGTPVAVELEGDLVLPVEVARLCYRVVHEGLHNVVKHAGAVEACVRIARDGDLVLVEVSDDGVGPGDPATRVGPDEGHLGLHLLREAVVDAGGELSLQPGTDGGALLRAVVPVAHLLAPPV